MSSRTYGSDRPRHREVLYPRTQHRYLEELYINGVFDSVVADDVKVMPQSGHWMDDVVVDGFSARRSRGEIIINPMSSTIVDWSSASAGGHFVLTSQKVSDYVVSGLIDGLHRPFLFPDAPQIEAWKLENAKDEAISRAFARLNSSNADLLIDLAGLRQTVEMFVSAGKRLASLAADYRSFLRILTAPTPEDWKRRLAAFTVGRHVRRPSLAGLWCELRFGWGPLLGTLDGIVATLKELDHEGQTKRETYRSSETVAFSQIAENTVQLHPIAGTTWNRVYSVSVDRTVNYRAGVIADRRVSALASLGLSWQAFPIAVWDVVPYSFIVDRFVNVGDVIRSLIPKSGVTIAAHPWVVTRDTSTTIWRSEYTGQTSTSSAGSATQPATSSALRCTIANVVRETIPGPPLTPVIRHDWASFNSLYNAIDGIMLAIQRLSPRQR